MQETVMKALRRPQWVLEKSYLWGRSYMNMKSDDIIFSFFPKTGSTWVRIFFFHLLSKRQDQFNFDEVNEVMPEFANPSFFKPWSFEGHARLVKTHRPYSKIFSRQKSVLFARDPRDTMVSFLHYANAKKEFGFSGDLNKLVRHPEMGLDRYFRFYQSWLPHAGLVVKYEDLRADAETHFTKLVEFVGLDVSSEEIRAALEESSLEQTRKAQERSSKDFKDKFEEGFTFARSGSAGEGREIFTSELDAFYREKREQYGFDLYPL